MTAPAFPQSARAELIGGIARSNMSKLAIRAAVLIALRVNSERGFAWPGYAHLQDELGCEKSSLVRAVKEIERERFFHVSRPAKPGRGRAIEFHPLPANRWRDRHLSGGGKGDETSTEKVTISLRKGDEMNTPYVEGIADGSADARERGNSNSKRNAKPSKPRAWHGPDSCSAGGGKRGGFSLADAALEYIRDAGE